MTFWMSLLILAPFMFVVLVVIMVGIVLFSEGE